MTDSPRSAVIIGSGFAGLCIARALKSAGIHDFVILEKAPSLGGTWRDNTYPGCACDIPSHLYSLSFALNPDWSATYAPQHEIRAYLERLADAEGLREHLRLNTEATDAQYDATVAQWTVTTRAGEVFVARNVVSAVGPLHRFSLPKIPGLETFKGEVFHSANWPEGFDPRDRDVAVIGTGASAIQIIPELAKSVRSMAVYQRTPPWVMPRFEREYSQRQKSLFAKFPALMQAFRQSLFWTQEARSLLFVRNDRLRSQLERLGRDHLQRTVADPTLRQKLTPSIRLGCKRILLSNTYYPALQQPNVSVHTAGIREITPDGIVTNDGQRQTLDTLVFATGFDVHDYLGAMHVRGLDGRDLGEQWARDGATAHLGCLVSGYPNLYFLVGPNTGLGHNSILYMMEAQTEVIMKCIAHAQAGPRRSVQVRDDVQRDFNQRIQAQLRDTVWHTGCKSWYLDEEGRNSTLWPGTCHAFGQQTKKFSLADCVVNDLP
ncbi:MAG: NAD(P)/FAD-dependent oxidoreductase [Deltaproteobacteria bacterium]|nr:NAD(P)/FAD-dependent oxidoreductase [Deltaproteobacteria bacterium]